MSASSSGFQLSQALSISSFLRSATAACSDWLSLAEQMARVLFSRLPGYQVRCSAVHVLMSMPARQVPAELRGEVDGEEPLALLLGSAGLAPPGLALGGPGVGFSGFCLDSLGPLAPLALLPDGGKRAPRLGAIEALVQWEFDLLFVRDISRLPTFERHAPHSSLCLKHDLGDGRRLAVQIRFDDLVEHDFVRSFGFVSTSLQSIFQRSRFFSLLPGGAAPKAENDWRAYAASLEELLSLHETIFEHQALELEERRLVIENFLNSMSHEIRTPLNAISGMSLALLDSPLSPLQFSHLETIKASSNHLLAIANNILSHSRITSGRAEQQDALFSLRTCVEDSFDIVASAAEAKGIWAAYIIEPGVPAMLVSDAGWIRQILVNLLSNAVKFTPSGEILLRVSSCPTANGKFRVRFAVQDSGIGIPSDRLQKLFKPFSQVNESLSRAFDGAGLGLSISRALSQKLGGDIEVESVPGEGSVFSFEVLAEGPPPAAEPGDRPRWGERCVLLVDPHAAHNETLRRTLEPWLIQVVAVDSPAEALSALDSQRFDALLVSQHLASDLALALSGQPPRVLDLPRITISSPHNADATPLGPLSLRRPARCSSLQAVFAEAFHLLQTRPPPRPTENLELPGLASLRVLAAEDNKMNQRVLLLLLDKLGCKAPELVSNGAEAVAAFAREPAHIVLMDLQMPQMDGFEATRQLRELSGSTKDPWIIALTASAFDETRDACLRAGMNDFSTKPVALEALRNSLQAAIDRGLEPPESSLTLTPRSRTAESA